jgi:hypothetical protein
LNVFIDPEPPGGISPPLLDPRRPPQYGLDLPSAAHSSPVQLCMVPGPTFTFPQGTAFQRGKYLLAATDPVTLMRESQALAQPATLTLRLRDQEILPDPAELRVLRKNPDTGIGVDLGIPSGQIKLVDLEKGKGVSFPITRFGTYVVARESGR